MQFLSKHTIELLDIFKAVDVEPHLEDTPAAFVSICEALLKIPKVRVLEIESGHYTTGAHPWAITTLNVCELHKLPWVIEHLMNFRLLIDPGYLTTPHPGWPNRSEFSVSTIFIV